MNPYEEWVKEKRVEDVDKFFKFIGISPSLYGDLSMPSYGKERINRMVLSYRKIIIKRKNEILDIKSRVNYGPAPRKSKYDPQTIKSIENEIERMKNKMSWAKFHIRNLGWDISDEELELN